MLYDQNDVLNVEDDEEWFANLEGIKDNDPDVTE
jgi:hypothetical protein